MQILLISINKFDLYEWVKNIIFEHNLKTKNMKKLNINGLEFYFNPTATVLQICEYLYSIRFDLLFVDIKPFDFDIENNDTIVIRGKGREFRFFVKTIVPIF